MEKLSWQDLIIKRARWLRGSPGETRFSFLRHPDNDKQCCLGFYARQCGIATKAIRGIATPDNIWGDDERRKVQRLFLADTISSLNEITDDLMAVNDDSNITAKKRESQIRKLFRKLKVRVRFID
jgi:hypothetical protein